MDYIQMKKLQIAKLKLRKVNCEIRIANLELQDLRENTYQQRFYE